MLLAILPPFLALFFSTTTYAQHGRGRISREARSFAVREEELAKRDDPPPGFESPPYYPTPQGGWVDSWAEAYKKAHAVVSNMTLAEKVNLTTGTGLWMVRVMFYIPRVRCLL